ncbi:hypothetical protein BN1088_510002 [Sphingobacterium sp. PM2-P1-29]|nr:hypothetical protein BN1088_510002 [Sphingobacterium sp. PM2-P1-29]
MTTKEFANVKNYIKHMAKFNIRIVKADESGNLIGLASGFIYHPDKDKPPIVITAGHSTPEKGCFIETNIIEDGKTICINAGEFKVFHTQEGVDYAYSYLNNEMKQNETHSKSNFAMISYLHEFVKADGNEEYGFAVLNNYEFVNNGDTLILPRYYCYEVGLKLVKQEEHLNYFKTMGQIKDHEYYKGASGSPVSDPEGKITGILVGGTDPIELLKVFRLDNIDWQINSGE